jgi:hypothetical protein
MMPVTRLTPGWPKTACRKQDGADNGPEQRQDAHQHEAVGYPHLLGFPPSRGRSEENRALRW